MIPITRNINLPKVPPKPSMINFVRTNTSTLNNPKSQTMQSTGNFSLNKKIKNSMSSHTISVHKPVPNRSPSLEFEKYKSEQSENGVFYLEANKLKLSYRPSLGIKEKKTLKFSKFWKKTEETKYSKDLAGTKVKTNLISGTDSEQESTMGKSNFSKKFRNFGLKKGAESSAHKSCYLNLIKMILLINSVTPLYYSALTIQRWLVKATKRKSNNMSQVPMRINHLLFCQDYPKSPHLAKT